MILFQGGTLVTEHGAFRGDLRIEGETIQQIASSIDAAPAEEVIDCSGCYVFPGAIDPHTHFAMTNALTTTADDYASGTAAALVGGTTTILNFASPQPGEAKALHQAVKRESAKADGKAYCDYAFHMEILDDSQATLQEIEELTALGVDSYKVYLAYAFRLSDDQIYRVAQVVKRAGGVLGAHCENGDLMNALTEELAQANPLTPADHPKTRPPIVEAEAIHRFATIGRLAQIPVHVVHLSSQDGLEAIREQRRQGATITAETCPQYLLLDEALYEQGFEGAKYVCSPPLRTKTDRESLLDAIADGEIQTLATDHCSYRFDTQKKIGKDDARNIPGGIPGVQFRPALAYTQLLAAGRLSPEAFVRLVATNAAKHYGLYPRKGVLAEGSDADLVVYDPAGSHVITTQEQIEAVDYTPYEGQTVQGSVRSVWLRGKKVAESGRILGEPEGRFVPADRTYKGGTSQ